MRTVALLCGNPALSSILLTELASSRTLRVRAFETPIQLAYYAAIAPVDLVVADLDDEGFDIELIEAADLSVATPIIGIARNPERLAGVLEVLAKPMSPRFLLERVLALLPQRPASGPSRPSQPQNNVVTLFP